MWQCRAAEAVYYVHLLMCASDTDSALGFPSCTAVPDTRIHTDDAEVLRSPSLARIWILEYQLMNPSLGAYWLDVELRMRPSGKGPISPRLFHLCDTFYDTRARDGSRLFYEHFLSH